MFESDPAQEQPPFGPRQLAPKERFSLLWREWLKPFLVIAITLLSFRSAVADWNHVPTGSMMPTILVGDRIFVNKMAYDLRFPFTRFRLAEWGAPEHGDVVVFLSPHDGKRLVKRVIGTPGDEIVMRAHRLIVNGEPAEYAPVEPGVATQLEERVLEEHRLHSESLTLGETHPIMTSLWLPSLADFDPVVVPADHYFVMGDNRDDSADSREFGFVEASRILGKATGVALSVDPDRHFTPRWDRFFRNLP